MIFCYVGTHTVVGERAYEALGQRAQFDAETYKRVILGGGAFIPQENFDKIGFDPEELAAYGLGANQGYAPEAFQEKLRSAVQVLDDIRKEMSEGN